MKKLLSRLITCLLCLLLPLGCVAEDASARFTPRTCYVSDTEYTYQVPQEWFDLELSEEDEALGVIAAYENEEQTLRLIVTLEESSAAVSFAKLTEHMAQWTGYTQVSQVLLSGKPFITYRLEDSGVDGLLYLMDDALFEKPLLLHFDFVLSDRTDRAAVSLAAQIAATIAPPDVEE